MKTKILAINTSIISVVGLLWAGCATTPKVETEYDPAANFAAAKTFVVLPLPQKIPGVDPGLLLRVGPAAVNSAAAALYELGYKQVDDVKYADIAVLVHGKKVPKTDVTDWGFTPYVGGYGWYGRYPYGAGVYGSNITVDQYDEGTLIVEVYDVKSEKQIWVGWMTGRSTTDKSKQAGNVSEGVAMILANYPAAGMAPTPPAAK